MHFFKVVCSMENSIRHMQYDDLNLLFSQFSVNFKLGTMKHIHFPDTQKVEAGGPGAQSLYYIARFTAS